MMLPTLLVVPGIYLKSDIAHSTSISVTPGFRLKSTGFLSEQWTILWHLPDFKPPLPSSETHFLCCFLYDPTPCSNARKTGEE